MVDSDQPTQNKAKTLLWMDRVLGLRLDEVLGKPVEVPADVQALVEEREQARAQKDWPLSDKLRVRIAQLGYTVEDTDQGPVIK